MPMKLDFFRIYRATDVDVVMAFSVDTRLVLSIKSHMNYDVSWLDLTLLSFRRVVIIFAATILSTYTHSMLLNCSLWAF